MRRWCQAGKVGTEGKGRAKSVKSETLSRIDGEAVPSREGGDRGQREHN